MRAVGRLLRTLQSGRGMTIEETCSDAAADHGAPVAAAEGGGIQHSPAVIVAAGAGPRFAVHTADVERASRRPTPPDAAAL